MNSTIRRLAPSLLAGALASLALLAAPTPAEAFCGFYVAGADTKLYNNATTVVMMRDGTRTVLAMQNNYQGPPDVLPRHRVILAISGVHQGTLVALRYARSLSADVTAVHVSLDPDEAEKVKAKWETWGQGVRLVILDSPYRLLLEPLLGYIAMLAAQRQPNELITIVVPQFVPRRWWHNLLHTQAAVMLRLALLFKPGIVVTDVPYHVS